MRVSHNQDPARLRHGAYPEAREQLGALIKGQDVLLAVIDLLLADAKPATAAKVRALLAGPDGSEARAMVEQIRAVKAQHPKREAGNG